MAQVFQGMPKNDIGGSIGNALGAIGGQTLGQKMAAMHQQKQIEKKWEGLTPLLLQMGQTPESIKQYKASGSDPTPLVPFFKIAAQNSQDQNYGNALNDYYGNAQQQPQGGMGQLPPEQQPGMQHPTEQLKQMISPGQGQRNIPSPSQPVEPEKNKIKSDKDVEKYIKDNHLNAKQANAFRREHRENVDQDIKRQTLASNLLKEDQKHIFEFKKPYEDQQKFQRQVKRLNQAKDLIENGNVNLEDNWGTNVLQAYLDGTPVADILKTPEQHKLWHIMSDFLDTKGVGGSNPSTKEVLISMSKLANQFKGKEANSFIIDSMIDLAENNLETSKYIHELKGGKGMTYDDFVSNVHEHQAQAFNEHEKESGKPYGSGKIILVEPETGREFYPKSKEQLDKFKKLKWEIIYNG